MKKIASGFIILLFLLTVGCGPNAGETGREGKILGGRIHPEGNHKIIGEYGSFTGRFYRIVELEKGESYHFTLKKSSNDGTLKLFVIDKKTDDISMSRQDKLTLKPKRTGLYSIEIIGKKHKTGFVVNW